jgi:ADP-ribosylglycohydrolase
MEQKIYASGRIQRVERALCALEGLSVGDAFGERFFLPPEVSLAQIEARTLPEEPWLYTDDTQMALSLVEVLSIEGMVEQDILAKSFADRYEPGRGYGPSMHGLLRALQAGRSWQQAAKQQFAGQGSFGNGAAMRVAPLGAFFADDLHQVIEQAERSAEITHAHPEAVAGAIAVALAVAWAWRFRKDGIVPTRYDFLDPIINSIPSSEVRAKLRWARDASEGLAVETAAAMLGNGSQISAPDTVPFALWCAAEHMSSFEHALWQTVRALGDIDTNCAIVGGVVSMYVGLEGIPVLWRQAREALPGWIWKSKQIDENDQVGERM